MSEKKHNGPSVETVLGNQAQMSQPAAGWKNPRRKHSTLLRRKQFDGQWCGRPLEMLESPPFRALSLSGHRFLALLEIELRHHGGHDNGKLPCTYEDCKAYGIGNRHCIAAAQREVQALGFAECTERGRAGNREFRTPNKWRLTYLPLGRAKATNEWKRIKTPVDAEQIAKAARNQKQNSGVGFGTVSVSDSDTKEGAFSVSESDTTDPVSESDTTLDISGKARPASHCSRMRARRPAARARGLRP